MTITSSHRWCLIATLLSSLFTGRVEAAGLDSFERKVLDEINRLRADPAAYSKDLKELESSFHGMEMTLGDGKTIYKSREGWAAVAEAIKDLQAAEKAPKLSVSTGLTKAAEDHASEQGKTGELGHEGKGGSRPSQRIRTYGKTKVTGECIAYGDYKTIGASHVVMQLVIDDGVKDRQHRAKLLDPQFDDVGIACGPHPSLGQVCVIDFAQGYEEGGAKAPAKKSSAKSRKK